MKPKFAFDRTPLDTSPSNREYDKENGFLRVKNCNISMEQIREYRGMEIVGWEKLGLDPDKVYRLYCPAEELIKAAESSNVVPLLVDHHEMDAKNPAKEETVGATGSNAKFVSPHLQNMIAIHDQWGIDLVESGKAKELSACYSYRADMTPGTFNGEHYDGIMRDIVFNHVALVEEGRAGPTVAVADSIHGFTKRTYMTLKQKLLRAMDSIRAKAKDGNLEEAKEAATEVVAMIESAQQGGGSEAAALEQQTPEQIIETIVEMLPEENREEARDQLVAVLGGGSKAEASDEEEAIIAKKKVEAEELSPEAKAALEASGLALDSEEVNKAFKAGQDFAMKGQDNTGAAEKGADNEGAATKAADSKMIIKRAEDAAHNRLKKIDSAMQEMRPILGSGGSVFAFDSADGVYRAALKREGVSMAGMSSDEIKGMARAYAQTKEPEIFTRAMDSAAMGELPKEMAGLSKIRIEE